MSSGIQQNQSQDRLVTPVPPSTKEMSPPVENSKDSLDQPGDKDDGMEIDTGVDPEKQDEAEDTDKENGSDEDSNADISKDSEMEVEKGGEEEEGEGEDEKESGEEEGGSADEQEGEEAEGGNEKDQGSELEKSKVKSASVGGLIPQSTIDKINRVRITKVKRDETEELDPTHAVRKMKVTTAFSRYQRFKAIHEESLKAFKEFQESTKAEDDPVDFDGELEWMMTALSISDQALKKREIQLNEAITEGQEEIEIIPFRNPMPRIVHPVVKRKAVPSNKQNHTSSSKRYLDLEAEVDDKEGRDEGCGGRKKRRKQEYKSAEIYIENGEFDQDVGDGGNEEDQEEEIKGPDAVQGEVVNAKDVVKKGKSPAKKNPPKSPEPPVDELPISLDSIFHNSDSILDISKLIKDPTTEEISFLRDAAATLTSNQFDWGEALKDSVISVVSCWKYHENSQLGQPTHETIQPLVVLMKRKVMEKDTPKTIQACPRLLQVAATDPYLTETSINWPLIHESTRYPWDPRHRIFRAFHSMACRTSNSFLWTTERDIKNKLRTAYKTIHKIFEDSVEIISYNAQSDQIEIQTEGEHRVHSSMVPMSQSIAWAWQQCMMKAMEEQEIKSTKSHHQGMSWFQKRCLLVTTGMMLVYERDVYNRQLKLFCKTKRTTDEISARKNELKGSILNQLSLDYVRKNPIKAITGLKKHQVPTSDALAKVTEKEIVVAADNETFNFRRQAIQALALFLMFGTSGMFHVWVWFREQKMTDAALMIHMSSVLAQRRNQASKSEPHVFYQRSWSRLDHHLFSVLREFLDVKKGDFKRNIVWPDMTKMFHDRFSPTSLSYLFTLDLCLELHAPLSSRGPDGTVAPDFDSNSKNQGPVLIPVTEPFRSVWASTEGKAVPVTDPKGMYTEADGSRVTKKHPLKSITQAKEKARKEGDQGDTAQASGSK